MNLEPQVANLLSGLHVAAYVLDDSGRLIYLNPAATELTGWRLFEVTGRQAHEIFGGTVVCPCETCTGPSIHPPDLMCKAAEGTIRTRSGENRPVRVGVSELPSTAGPAYKVVVIEDLRWTCPLETPLDTGPVEKPAPPVQTAWSGLIDSLFDALPDGISVLDPDLTIRRVNRTMNEWYKHRMPLVGRRCYECYQKRIAPCLRCPSLRCLDTGQVEREIVAGPEDSPVRRIELLSFPLKDADTGKVYQVVEVVRDITALADLEQCCSRTAEMTQRVRALCQSLKNNVALKDGSGPSNVSMTWRDQIDSLASICQQFLDQWPDLTK
jgi:PAS domain S-box-containing protein